MTTTQKHLLSEEEVTAAFLWILGRLPESHAVVHAHRSIGSVEALRDILLTSHEFRSNLRYSHPTHKWVCTDVYSTQYRMWIDLRDEYVSRGCLNDNYEPMETAFIKLNVRSGQTVVDAGANLGWHTLGLALAVGPAGRVHCFEPMPLTRQFLLRTVVENRIDGFTTVHPYGLWNEANTLFLNSEANPRNPGGTSLTTSPTSLPVELRTLDSFAIPDIAFIKIDIEGAEPKAFEGAELTLHRTKPLILSELHPPQLENVSNSSPRSFINYMSDLGYSCIPLHHALPPEAINDYPKDIKDELISVVFSSAPDTLRWPSK